MRFYTLLKMRFRNISKCVFVVNLCSFVELPWFQAVASIQVQMIYSSTQRFLFMMFPSV